MPDPYSIDLREDRYSRLRLIPWWDQDLLARARVIVVGAGALGNEILKDLALLGIGNILCIDFDRVETSNLSRSVLYREADSGLSKATAAAEAVTRINPDCKAIAWHADVTRDVGAGVFRWADVVICGLDSRQARLAVNKACWRVNVPWVDGATESFQGVVRVFQPPDGVCYECTLSEQDLKLISVRNSCGFLATEALRRGGTPTTPTTSAVIAGIQVQEALKLLHGKAHIPNLIDKGFFFDGNTYDCFTITYSRRDDCLSHETCDEIVRTDLKGDTATLGDVLAAVRGDEGGLVIDLPGEMITGLCCDSCGVTEAFYRLLDSTDAERAMCPECGRLRAPTVVTECEQDSPFASIPLAELGFGKLEIVTVRQRDREAHIEISGDGPGIFGDRYDSA